MGSELPSAIVDAHHVRTAALACTDFLRAHADGDWQASIPDLDFSVRQVVAHVAQCCLFYATDLSAAGPDLTSIELTVNADAEPTMLIDTLHTAASMVANAVDAAPGSVLGFHPWGDADRSGFAAMACDEMLIHTDDAARGLGAAFTPPRELPEAILRRLFPEVATEPDPWQQLRWANGRIALGGAPRRERWKWHCSPLG